MNKIRKIASNYIGWRTDRKIVVFESDDWGSIRTRDKKVLPYLGKRGFDVENSNFVKLDSLEKGEDLAFLFEVLSSVKDKNGRSAVFTPLTIVTNPDFAKIQSNGFSKYELETFDQTASRYSGSANLLATYQEGYKSSIFMPEYHGREHLNYLRWMRGLRSNEKGIKVPFELETIGLTRVDGSNIREHLAAYDPEFSHDIPLLAESLSNGLDIFEELFGFKARYFVASKSPEPKSFETNLIQRDVNFVLRYKMQRYPKGNGRYSNEINWLGKRQSKKLITLTRNCGFEPNGQVPIDWKDRCLADISLAFRFNKPAVVSSHRVNYVSRLSLKNRENGLNQLSTLLKAIVKKWPNVEFMSSSELGDAIIKNQKR